MTFYDTHLTSSTEIHAILKGSYLALTVAWTQYSAVEERKKQCGILIRRCKDLLFEVSQQMENNMMTPSIDKVERLEHACSLVADAIVKIAKKSFTWRLLHQSQISQSIAEAQSAVMDALSIFNFGAHLDAQQLQIEIAAAREDDQNELVAHLKNLEASDKRILEALQADGRELRRLEELIIALTKHVQNLTSNQADTHGPTNKFIRTATGALQRLSREPAPELEHWTRTSFEVQFNRDDKDSHIGVGGFGDVYQGEWGGSIVAVKELNNKDARTLDRKNLTAIRQEINTWSRLRHPHVLPFYGACLEAFRPFIISKFCRHGNALDYLRAWPNADRISILYGVTLGMTYLHHEGLIHADLKAANILIGDSGESLIADFGSSRFRNQVRSQTIGGYISIGTLRWLAPEVLDGGPLSKPADLYSFAITMWEIFTESAPFDDVLDDRVLMRKVVDEKERPSRPESMNDSLWKLVQQCWSPEPSSRPSFDAVQIKLKPLMGFSQNSPQESLLDENGGEPSHLGYSLPLAVDDEHAPMRAPGRNYSEPQPLHRGYIEEPSDVYSSGRNAFPASPNSTELNFKKGRRGKSTSSEPYDQVHDKHSPRMVGRLVRALHSWYQYPSGPIIPQTLQTGFNSHDRSVLKRSGHRESMSVPNLELHPQYPLALTIPKSPTSHQDVNPIPKSSTGGGKPSIR